MYIPSPLEFIARMFWHPEWHPFDSWRKVTLVTGDRASGLLMRRYNQG